MRFLPTVVAVCTRFAAYADVRRIRATDAVLYLVRLAVLVAALMMVGLIPRALQLADDVATWTKQHLPGFAIQNGRVVSSLAQPYYGGTADWAVILDTTGQITEPDSRWPHGVLIGADTVTVWLTQTNESPPTVRIQRHSLRSFPDGQVDAEYVRRLLRSAIWVGAPLAFVGLVIAAVVLGLLQAHFFALVATLLAVRQQQQLTFPELRNIALFALTPAAIIVAVYTAARVPGLDLWWVYLIAFSVSLLGGINACRRQRHDGGLADDESA